MRYLQEQTTKLAISNEQDKEELVLRQQEVVILKHQTQQEEDGVTDDMDQVKQSLREMQSFLSTLQQVPDRQNLLREHMVRTVAMATKITYDGEDDSDSDFDLSESDFEGGLIF